MTLRRLFPAQILFRHVAKYLEKRGLLNPGGSSRSPGTTSLMVAHGIARQQGRALSGSDEQPALVGGCTRAPGHLELGFLNHLTPQGIRIRVKNGLLVRLKNEPPT